MFAAIALIVGLLAGTVLILSFLLPAYKVSCFAEGPFPEGFQVSERQGIVAKRTVWWPIGRACDWYEADGTLYATTYSGSVGATALAYGLLAVGATGAVLLVAGPSRKSAGSVRP